MNMVVNPAEIGGCPVVRYSPGERDRRPWGTWEVLATGPQYTLKRIIVHPGHRLSLQYHNHRSEHWTIVSGRAEVEIDGAIELLRSGEHIEIPLRAIDAREPAVGRRHPGDPFLAQERRQAPLESAEQPLHAAPRLGRVARDVLDAELRRRPPDQAIYVENWTVWDNIWDGLAFRSEDLRPAAANDAAIVASG